MNACTGTSGAVSIAPPANVDQLLSCPVLLRWPWCPSTLPTGGPR